MITHEVPKVLQMGRAHVSGWELVSQWDTATDGKPDTGCPQGGGFVSTCVIPYGKRPLKGLTKGRFSDLWLCR